MGHADETMASVYREGIDPQRIIDVCSYVRDWWLDGKLKNEQSNPLQTQHNFLALTDRWTPPIRCI
jgi:hypothetical protein